INVVCLTVLLMSGLNIFNAHPALYWGEESIGSRPWLVITAVPSASGPVGVSRSSVSGAMMLRALPSWATIPGARWLSMARHWHLFFPWVFVVNGLAY